MIEVEQAINAICASETRALRYGGTDEAIIGKLRARGAARQCDHSPGFMAWRRHQARSDAAAARLKSLAYRDRLRIWESDYGRSDGWDVELGGRAIAFLDEPQYEDMFWESYRITPTTNDPELAERLLTDAFWKEEESNEFVYRSRATGLITADAFPSPRPFVAPARVNMRRLYLPIGAPWPWDWLVLAVRRIRRRASRKSGSPAAGEANGA